jgi:hypothetical protein
MFSSLIEAYMEDCIFQNSKRHIIAKEANPMIREPLLENLLRNDIIILNPQEGEGVILTKKS